MILMTTNLLSSIELFQEDPCSTMGNYLIDTNIVSALLKDNQDVAAKLKEAVIRGEEVVLNGVTYYEVKRGLLASGASHKLSKFLYFCREFGVVWLDSQDVFDEASEIYADLKRTGSLIEDADILIAAVARVGNFILVTDDQHFQKVAGIETRNWLSCQG